jgi:hypothetical protein
MSNSSYQIGVRWHPRSALDSTNYRKIVSRQKGAIYGFPDSSTASVLTMTDKNRALDKSVTFPPINSFGSNVGGGKMIWKGKQFTSSQGHRKSHDGKYREGGPFFTYRMEPDIPTGLLNFRSSNGSVLYKGPCVMDSGKFPTTLGSAKGPSADSSYLDPFGAEAISLVDPSNPNAEAGVALAEIIRERKLPIPVIQGWKRRTELAKAASSEYLNAVFGWLPLVDEMKNVAQSVRDGNTILENYSNASGSFVHREFEFEPIESTETTNLGTGVPTIAAGSGPGFGFVGTPGQCSRERVSTTRRWFSGAFTYHADSENSSFQKALGYGSDAEKLFGISLTPDIVWELTPWSWAIDWFSNAQNVIHNIGAFKLAGLVMRYGFIMEEISIVDTYHLTGFRMGGALPGPVNVPSATFTYTVKRRREANPFGFGLSWDGLSPTQLAITAALGITRLR